MPKRVVVIYSCSLCAAEFDSPEKVATWRLTGPDQVLAYDICATCDAAHEGLLALIAPQKW